MANNPYVNKVQKADGTTIIDISDTTAVASDVASGKYFYTAAGQKVMGTSSGGSYEDGDEMAYGSAGLAGTTWYFNETLNMAALATYYLDFTSNNNSYSVIDIQAMGSGNGALSFEHDRVYVYFPPFLNDGWSNQAYRTISITGGDDAANQDLIDWLTANAVQQ